MTGGEATFGDSSDVGEVAVASDCGVFASAATGVEVSGTLGLVPLALCADEGERARSRAVLATDA